MKIVFLDGYTATDGDLSWAGLEALGELVVYDRTEESQVIERASEASVILTNKAKLSRKTIEQLPNLRFIGVTATGVNNVDLIAAREHGVIVTNVKGYSSDAVAQHTFALLLALTNHLEMHSDSVRAGDWASCEDWSYRLTPLIELSGKTLGLIGLGDIGSAVAKIGQAFGMKVIAYRKNAAKGMPDGVIGVDLTTLFNSSDVVSLHCPLTDETEGIINSHTLKQMKESAYLINTGRGPLINETELAEALNNGIIAGAGLDVLSQEPPQTNNPLIAAKNCIITPHIAWAAFEARKRLLKGVADNIKAFINGAPINVVN